MIALILTIIFFGIALGISIFSLKEYHDHKKTRQCYEELIIELIKELEEYRDSDND